MKRQPYTLDTLPLYATDEEIGEVVLGVERKGEFKGLAVLLERQGMPKISPLLGGRYVPAVKQFFDTYNGLSQSVPARPDGTEGEWTSGRNARKARA
ncbi:hypothetical protein [Bradyrhizobium jicamae]|uniref:hypothetical protein n=1 Tax=Bradyrhizobium jicamae TaxID=280332 RepID=UPI001BA83FE1|nr:hypothetical protein [Bradyrhizobium jicamae]MBR0934846.1 hypothetical protein [Bradyrhizobium jicamae]